jgi:ribosomal protein S18 acetylase RimI-like enzyme
VPAVRNRLKARLFSDRDRGDAIALLERNPRQNLQLLDLASRLGRVTAATEMPPQLVGAWRARQLVGIASIRPSVVLDSGVDEDMLDAWMPYFEAVPSGLIKSAWDPVTSLWERLSSRGRGFLVDRSETAYAVVPQREVQVEAPIGVKVRPASEGDLDALVEAARASLREEGRPDPFDGDPPGFRRWVRGRLPRARVVEAQGRVVFAGYADVRRPEGWLVQGVYTFPEARRSGFASAGMSAIVREAFAAGADHVQLAVVSGNTSAERLYERLGFEPFDRLRTVLFL